MAIISTPFSGQALRKDGRDLVGAFIRYFDAGTNTPRTVYKDGTLLVPWDHNGIRSDQDGVLPIIFLQGGPYKVIISAAGGNEIRTVDNIPGDPGSGGVGGGGGGGGAAIPVGMVSPRYGTGTLDGYVRANGRTIGNASSGATERPNADMLDLFLYLWAASPLLQVLPDRGATALADWDANKQISLPDMRGRALAGLDDMGAASADTFAGVTFSLGDATSLGSMCGAATYALTAAQLASHAHSGSTGFDGTHQHSGVTSYSGAHNHGGFVVADGQHAHTASAAGAGDHTHNYLQPSTKSAVAQGAVGGYWFGSDVPVATSSAGFHSHFITVDLGGFHSHGIALEPTHFHDFVTLQAGSHNHSFTTGSAGTGQAHLNMQPTMLVTYYIKA